MTKHKYLIYADDLSIWRFFAVPFIYLPMTLVLGLSIYRAEDKAAVVCVALCGFFAAYPMFCTFSHFSHKSLNSELILDSDDKTETIMQVIQSARGNGKVDLWELTNGLDEKVKLFRSHIEYAGSGCYQYEVLFSKVDGQPLDSVSYHWSANQAKSIFPDWIVPLTYEPGHKRQFWMRICQEESKSALITISRDGKFEIDEPIKASLPLCLLLIPLFLVLLRLRIKGLPIIVPYLFLFGWALLYLPWRIWF